MEGKKRVKVDGDIEISEEAVEKIRKDAVNDYKKVEYLVWMLNTSTSWSSKSLTLELRWKLFL